MSVEGHRWTIEDSFDTAKNEPGLDHNETRSWHGWQLHLSLVMLAFAMMAVIRYCANEATPPIRARIPTIRTCSPGRSRKVGGSPTSLLSVVSGPPASSLDVGDERIKPLLNALI
ncbi:hypothetical protein J2W40_003960 [Sphingobium xenophagum]|uniref:Transposase IS4-like domain-containing protein n=1 Tax=Sphingobium xenophagum TaxID=121428 RepID=A0ABU1X7T9_SPHXE|nr:hypothetical protein [Sphingobium xenophagum]